MSVTWSNAVRCLDAIRTGGESMAASRWRIDAMRRHDRTKRRIAGAFGARVALPIAFAAIAFVGVCRAGDMNTGATGGIQAKLSYCKDCHGPSAQGYDGYFPIPRLAGQQTEYLENQLRAFIEHRRTNNIMFNVAHALSPGMIAALAADFRGLDPKPIGGAPTQFVALGKKIFQDGVPDANIAACAACHGPAATGSGPIPRLAGQLYPYLIKELVNWGKERGQNPTKPDTSAIMSPVAHSLNRSQIEAVAAYVSYLK
jgi:cytochrome c553